MKKKNFQKNPRQIVQGLTAAAMLFIAAQGQAQVVTPPTGTVITPVSRVKDFFVDNLNVREPGTTTDATAKYRRFLTPSLGAGASVFFSLNLGGGSEISQFYQSATTTSPLLNSLRFSKDDTAGSQFLWEKVTNPSGARTRSDVMKLDLTGNLTVAKSISTKSIAISGGPMLQPPTTEGSIFVSGTMISQMVETKSISTGTNPSTRGPISGGIITGSKFFGDGSGLTNLPGREWTRSGTKLTATADEIAVEGQFSIKARTAFPRSTTLMFFNNPPMLDSSNAPVNVANISVLAFPENNNNLMAFNFNHKTGSTVTGMALSTIAGEPRLVINPDAVKSANTNPTLHVRGNGLFDEIVSFNGGINIPTGTTSSFWEILSPASTGELLIQNGTGSVVGSSTFAFRKNGDLVVPGNLTVKGTTTQQNVIQQNGNFTVTGNSKVDLNHTVVGNSNLQGKVGIGTSTLHPNATLTVDGHVHISEKGGTNNSTWLATHTPNYLLWVEKGIVTTDFALAEPTGWKDEVFKADYKLPTLTEVEKHIKEKGYLHTMPSEKEITTNGYSLHDMNKRMLQTIEELTLHSIAQEKEINSQNDLINNLMKRLELLEKNSH